MLFDSDSVASNVTLALEKSMRELEILITFGASTNTDGSNIGNWCDDIEVFIDYDTLGPYW